jgi:hypothetical protein
MEQLGNLPDPLMVVSQVSIRIVTTVTVGMAMTVMMIPIMLGAIVLVFMGVPMIVSMLGMRMGMTVGGWVIRN